jgi:cytochrome c oxidase subunit IV
MPPRFRSLLLAWLLLILLGAAQFGVSFLPLGPSVRPAILTFAAAMIVTVALAFMRINTGPTIVRGFAVAGLFWLIVLVGLGGMDPLTRTDYHVQQANPE